MAIIGNIPYFQTNPFPTVFALGCSALEAAGHAKELQSLFEIFASASDMRMLEQVQELSDVILRGLDRGPGKGRVWAAILGWVGG